MPYSSTCNHILRRRILDGHASFSRRCARQLAKVLVHMSRDEHTMAYMFEFLELLGIERGRVLFRNQVRRQVAVETTRRRWVALELVRVHR